MTPGGGGGGGTRLPLHLHLHLHLHLLLPCCFPAASLPAVCAAPHLLAMPCPLLALSPACSYFALSSACSAIQLGVMVFAAAAAPQKQLVLLGEWRSVPLRAVDDSTSSMCWACAGQQPRPRWCFRCLPLRVELHLHQCLQLPPYLPRDPPAAPCRHWAGHLPAEPGGCGALHHQNHV